MVFIKPRKNRTVKFGDELLTRRALLWTPTEITTLGWWDASDNTTITEVSNKVSQFNDKSGEGNHLTQISSAAQPTTNSRTKNGLNFLDFDGGDHLENLALPSSIDATGETFIFQVAEYDSYLGPTFITRLYGDDNLIAGKAWDSDIRIWREKNGTSGAYATIGGGNSDAFTMDGYKYDATADTLTFWSNGTEYGPTSDITGDELVNTFTKLQMSVPTNWLNGGIGEIIISKAIDTATREKVDGYLAHKWGLASELPVGHPYKSHPPLI